jgi:hypothetical protein
MFIQSLVNAGNGSTSISGGYILWPATAANRAQMNYQFLSRNA